MLKVVFGRRFFLCGLLVSILLFSQMAFANTVTSSTDPYAAGKISFDPYFKKTVISGKLVVVLDGSLNNRALKLIKPPSRGVSRYQVHELIITDEVDAAPGATVNRVAYLGFMEIQNGGVLLNGDAVLVNGKQIGTLVGYDETHMPNHQNIVIKAATMQSGKDLNLKTGDTISFVHKKN